MANMRTDAVEKKRSSREVLDRVHGKSGACLARSDTIEKM